ncbi:type III-B CRISPR module RAMP protein Cmr4 [Hazenella sp. IB182353]|uniref:type III-B CRISPR module RAMP protein Cmr4 n=1 Tax=Polycladospora coralii TaxID=2771432 RepID=UPI0017477494|nr:type III-B CRISPR module RAMP protein Cmr4 [Polycladospora coralii]MBS7530237.1 type III-B CRISPR module RAMP protein Cmr4 [Polycladospora coralii]
MKASILGMLAETPIHPGAGQSLRGIDQPVARESVTGYPVIAGSGMKGALRDWARAQVAKEIDIQATFGESDQAGSVSVTDARLLLLPIRTLTGVYKWVTCPYILERLWRDLRLMKEESKFSIPQVGKGEFVSFTDTDGKHLFLEEHVFQHREKSSDLTILSVIKALIRHQEVKERLKNQLILIHDEDFAHFAAYGLSIRARNQLHNQTKMSENLWYEETLAPDTLMYSLLIPRAGIEDGNKAHATLLKKLEQTPYVQVGGNETLGQGWFHTQVVKEVADHANIKND